MLKRDCDSAITDLRDDLQGVLYSMMGEAVGVVSEQHGRYLLSPGPS
jgi:hypothetical protein